MSDDHAKFSDWKAERGPRGRFISSSGRPVGAKGKASQASVRAITDLKDLAFIQLKTLLAAGHPETVRFVIQNLIPAGGRAVTLDDLSADGLMQAVADGVISPAELAKLATGIEKIRAVEDLEAVRLRVEALEKLLKDGSL